MCVRGGGEANEQNNPKKFVTLILKIWAMEKKVLSIFESSTAA